MRDSDSEFSKDYNRWHFKKNIHECEEEWRKFEQKYGIEENSWLCNMWQLRSHWVPAYFRDTFTAGMSSSSRSENMDIAMRNAIRTVFPNTRHRFCSWHIQRHLVEHIAHMRDSDSEFSKDYNRWHFKKNIHECEEEWGKFEQKYGIEENSWLCNMWQLRSHWVPAYFRDTFTAGMSSSSRSESINSFFDGFVNHSTTLQEFVEQYDKALEDRRKKEAEEDFRTKSSNAILLSSRNKLEAQADKCYTRSMFTLFQIEIKDSNDCRN
ncbi:protein FAR1-RELATED SEQUENCE 5-like [Tasmannia lanceolata]|uniref:protein FAR1-RELATED SEQUENCE 5-like n=1 Tax=Tasmannia lanceolata TaxID=3420 RepID=UPI00406489CE